MNESLQGLNKPSYDGTGELDWLHLRTGDSNANTAGTVHIARRHDGHQTDEIYIATSS